MSERLSSEEDRFEEEYGYLQDEFGLPEPAFNKKEATKSRFKGNSMRSRKVPKRKKPSGQNQEFGRYHSGKPSIVSAQRDPSLPGQEQAPDLAGIAEQQVTPLPPASGEAGEGLPGSEVHDIAREVAESLSGKYHHRPEA